MRYNPTIAYPGRWETRMAQFPGREAPAGTRKDVLTKGALSRAPIRGHNKEGVLTSVGLFCFTRRGLITIVLEIIHAASRLGSRVDLRSELLTLEKAGS